MAIRFSGAPRRSARGTAPTGRPARPLFAGHAERATAVAPSASSRGTQAPSLPSRGQLAPPKREDQRIGRECCARHPASRSAGRHFMGPSRSTGARVSGARTPGPSRRPERITRLGGGSEAVRKATQPLEPWKVASPRPSAPGAKASRRGGIEHRLQPEGRLAKARERTLARLGMRRVQLAAPGRAGIFAPARPCARTA